jgi:phosphonate transport system substrate-binding protein
MTCLKQVLVSLALCFTIIMGCSETETETVTKPKSEETPLLIGLIPERNIFKQLDRYEPLADYLSKKIGVKTELKVLTRYGNIIDNFVSAGMDGAFFGSFTYTLAHAKLGVEAITRPKDIHGISTYHGLIFVRKDSGIKSVKDMLGKNFAFVDRATTAGYLLPLAYFKTHGIKNYGAFFKETYFTGTHEDAIYDVLNKKADIGAAKNTVFNRLAAEDSNIKNELVILERSPDVPENALAVKEGLDESIKNKLKETLLGMHNDPDGRKILRDFGAQKFIETTDDDYINVYSYTQEIGLDLTNYHYWNE